MLLTLLPSETETKDHGVFGSRLSMRPCRTEKSVFFVQFSDVLFSTRFWDMMIEF